MQLTTIKYLTETATAQRSVKLQSFMHSFRDTIPGECTTIKIKDEEKRVE